MAATPIIKTFGRPNLFRHMEVELRQAYHAEVPHNWLSGPANHPFFRWWWCDCGRVRLKIKNLEYDISAGQWALLPIRCQRLHFIDQGTVLVSVAFQAIWGTGTPLLNIPKPIIASGTQDTELRNLALQICRVTQEMETQTVDESVLQSIAAHTLQGYLHLFIATLFSRAVSLGCMLNGPGCGDDRLDNILVELNRNISAGPLPLKLWARQMGLSRSQLDRLAQKYLGISLRQHRDRLLLDEIHQRLSIGSESIKQISAAFSFVDTAHFCTWVRRQTGRTPMELRRTSSAQVII